MPVCLLAPPSYSLSERTCLLRAALVATLAKSGPSLQTLCVDGLARNLHVVSREAFVTQAWPEECLLALLSATLALGRLTPRTAELFLAVAPQHARLAAALASLRLQPVPAVPVAAGRPWLGDQSRLW